GQGIVKPCGAQNRDQKGSGTESKAIRLPTPFGLVAPGVRLARVSAYDRELLGSAPTMRSTRGRRCEPSGGNGGGGGETRRLSAPAPVLPSSPSPQASSIVAPARHAYSHSAPVGAGLAGWSPPPTSRRTAGRPPTSPRRRSPCFSSRAVQHGEAATLPGPTAAL